MAAVELKLPAPLVHANSATIGWVAHEEYIDYELANHGRHWLELAIATPCSSD
jgi:hypothetical protein